MRDLGNLPNQREELILDELEMMLDNRVQKPLSFNQKPREGGYV